MARQLFIYWRTAQSSAARALVAAAQCQLELKKRHAGLHTGLYRRAQEAAGDVTLMETYALPERGLDTALQAAIEASTAQALTRWCLGPRHVEVFDEVVP